jgi:hypothetical protein
MKLKKEEKVKKAITIEKKKESVQKCESGVRVTHIANTVCTLCEYTRKINGVSGKLRTIHNPSLL